VPQTVAGYGSGRFENRKDTMTSPTDQGLRQALQTIRDPELGRTLGELKMIDSTTVDGNSVRVGIVLPTPAYPQPERLRRSIEQTVEQSFPGTRVEVEFQARTRGRDGGGRLGMRVKNFIAVGSGKGGVGKSTIAAGIAYGLHHLGASVGLLDADVYGPSIPHLTGVSGQPTIKEMDAGDGRTIERMETHESGGVKVMSMGFMVPPEQAVIWRGPMLHKALTQMLGQTDWGELDYLIIDMPPGTGDVPLSLSQSVGMSGAVVVCTPQEVALLDAVKAVAMFRQVKIPVLGMVENMSGELFGRGGTRAKAEELKVPFLGEVPAIAAIRELGDAGRLKDLFNTGNPAREPLLEVSQRTAMEVARQLLDQPAMPQLEVL
jgi:ATP-binding protein involved in chromosome partitioning